jgi:hydrogenase maturation protein HypF
VELETVQDLDESGRYGWEIEHRDGMRVLRTDPLIRELVQDLTRAVPPAVVSRRFHNTMALLLAALCVTLREETGLCEVALSGGTFQNATLLSRLNSELDQAGFTVYTHALVPTNDGGISLGQAVCAAARSAGFPGGSGP